MARQVREDKECFWYDVLYANYTYTELINAEEWYSWGSSKMASINCWPVLFGCWWCNRIVNTLSAHVSFKELPIVKSRPRVDILPPIWFLKSLHNQMKHLESCNLSERNILLPIQINTFFIIFLSIKSLILN